VDREDLLRAQGMEPELLIAFAQDKQFFTAPAREVLMAYENLLLETLRPHATGTLVELGCGLGDKLLRMAERLKPKTVFGGEFTRSGVECGRLLAKLFRINAQFEQFDYNNPATLEAVPEHAMVFTSHSIEQIPNLPERFIAGLIRRSPRVVLHFEPDYEGHDTNSLMGLMQRRYAELNDYNRNLWGLLKSFESKGLIRILEHSTDVFGINPFNSTSVFIWQPV
jgi:SAM-dependent methyltransferase